MDGGYNIMSFCKLLNNQVVIKVTIIFFCLKKIRRNYVFHHCSEPRMAARSHRHHWAPRGSGERNTTEGACAGLTDDLCFLGSKLSAILAGQLFKSSHVSEPCSLKRRLRYFWSRIRLNPEAIIRDGLLFREQVATCIPETTFWKTRKSCPIWG